MKNSLSLFCIKNSLGPLEQEIMGEIWNSGKKKLTVREILGSQNKNKLVAYTTVMTVVDHLYNKGFLDREKIGKTYYYLPVINRDYVVKTSLVKLFRDLNSDYGKRKILYFAFSSSLPKFKIELPPYTVPVAYAASITFLVFIFVLSLYDFLQNISFLTIKDYLGFLTSDLNLFVGRLQFFGLAIFDNFPIVDVLSIIISFILVFVLFKKLIKAIDIKVLITG